MQKQLTSDAYQTFLKTLGKYRAEEEQEERAKMKENPSDKAVSMSKKEKYIPGAPQPRPEGKIGESGEQMFEFKTEGWIHPKDGGDDRKFEGKVIAATLEEAKARMTAWLFKRSSVTNDFTVKKIGTINTEKKKEKKPPQEKTPQKRLSKDLIVDWRKDGKKPIKTTSPGPFKNHAHVNKVLDKLHKKYPGYTIESYLPVETQEKSFGFCWHCKKEFKVPSVYGFYDFPCPKCKTKLEFQGGFKCSSKKCPGKFWLFSSKKIGPECIRLTYKCSVCGTITEDVLD